MAFAKALESRIEGECWNCVEVGVEVDVDVRIESPTAFHACQNPSVKVFKPVKKACEALPRPRYDCHIPCSKNFIRKNPCDMCSPRHSDL